MSRKRSLKEIQEDIRTLTRVPSEFIHAKLDELAEEIVELAKPKWIPCSERLPDREALCCDRIGYMLVGYVKEENTKYRNYRLVHTHTLKSRVFLLLMQSRKDSIPSKGLMQVIDPTFRAYAMKGFDKNIYDPMSNILAAIRYTLARYGSLERGWKGHGYANGGFPKVGEMFYARESGPELVGKIGNRSAVVNNQQIVDSVSNGVSRANDETNSLLRTIIEYQELLLKKETSVNMDGKRMDKQISKARRNTGFSFSPT